MKNVFKKISPTAYTVVSVVTGGLSIVATVFATKRTIKDFEDQNPQTFGDKARIVVKNYLPVALTYGISAGSAIASNVRNLSDKAALANVAVAGVQTISEYRNAIKEVVGPEEAQKIEEARGQKALECVKNDDWTLDTEEPTCVCMDAITRQTFTFPYHKTNDVKYRMIERLKSHDDVSATEYFDILDDVAGWHCVDSTSVTDTIGWNSNDLMNGGTGEIEFNIMVIPDTARNGKPVLLIDPEVPPYKGFNMF